MTADRLPGAARRAVRNRGGPAGYFFRPPPLDFRFVLRPPRVFVSPARARCLLTVRAAISSARGLPRAPQATTGDALIHPRIDTLLDHVDSHYAAVIVAAKRARQINNYYHTLGEGVFEEFPPPMVDTPSKNYLTIALEEVAQGKINSRYRV